MVTVPTTDCDQWAGQSRWFEGRSPRADPRQTGLGALTLSLVEQPGAYYLQQLPAIVPVEPLRILDSFRAKDRVQERLGGIRKLGNNRIPLSDGRCSTRR